jgi:hypothetical protein
MKKSELKQIIKEEIQRILKENPQPPIPLSPEELNFIYNDVLEAYGAWLDLENDEANEKGEVWDTEEHTWIPLKTFILSMIGRNQDPESIDKITSIINKLEYDKDNPQDNLQDYIKQYYPDLIQKLINKIKSDNPYYFR